MTIVDTQNIYVIVKLHLDNYTFIANLHFNIMTISRKYLYQIFHRRICNIFHITILIFNVRETTQLNGINFNSTGVQNICFECASTAFAGRNIEKFLSNRAFVVLPSRSECESTGGVHDRHEGDRQVED